MSAWQKPAVRMGGYIAFAAFALFLSFYITFPVEVLGQRLMHEVVKATDGKYIISYDKVSLHRISGVRVRNMRVRTTEETPTHFLVDDARVRLNLLPLLWFSVVVDTDISMGDARLRARVKPAKAKLGLQAGVQRWDLANPPWLKAATDLPFAGLIDGDVSVNWTAEDVKESVGDLTLTIESASMGPGTVQSFTVPKIQLGTLTLVLSVKDGQLLTKSFEQEGGDVELDLYVQSGLSQAWNSSSLDGCIRVKPRSEFLDREPKMKSVAQLAEVQLKKDGQQFLNVPFRGTLGTPKPQFRSLCRPRAK